MTARCNSDIHGHSTETENIAMQRSFTQKIWYALQSLIFQAGLSSFTKTYITYQPDAAADFNQHPEFKTLLKNFIEGNQKNNAGDIVRLWALLMNCKQILADNIPGDFAELGVWRGNTAAVLQYYASISDRKLFLFDTFTGFDGRDLTGTAITHDFSNTSIDMVRQTLGTDYGGTHFVKGYFPDCITKEHEHRQYALVHLDCDLFKPMEAGLNFFYPRMPRGGLFVLHDYSSGHWPGAKQAIDAFCHRTGEQLILMPDKSGSAFLRKSGQLTT